MTETITFHTFLEAIGITTVVFLFIYPVLGTVWEMSKYRYLKEAAAKKAAEK